MDDDAVKLALADIEATDDLLERALKLAGLVTTLFAERGFPLVVVGESAASSTPRFPMADDGVVSLTWEEWKASRAARREVLRTAGLDAPSRRKSGFGSSEKRLRAAFGAARVPDFKSGGSDCTTRKGQEQE